MTYIHQPARPAMAEPIPAFPVRLIIDAGHGGLDGGATSSAGLIEAPVNLDISLRLRDLLGFLGVQAVMTREDEASLDYSEADTIRENKASDLKARLEISRSYPDCPFLSIHLNHFSDKRYSGAQVFYSANHPRSVELADKVQDALREVVNPDNRRQAKAVSPSVYLMKHIEAPAVTIECGFLSHPGEAERLSQPEYQTKLALAIAKGYLTYSME